MLKTRGFEGRRELGARVGLGRGRWGVAEVAVYK